MTGHKAFHHVHLIADNITFQVHGKFFGFRLLKGFSWGRENSGLRKTGWNLPNQFRDRSVMAELTTQTMLPEVLIAIRIIQNSVVKEKRSPN